MSGELGTTNLLLGIMAAVSVLEALVVIGLGVAGFMAYRKVTRLVDGIERRQVAPAMAHVNAILDDVRTVTAKVKEETERVEHAIHATMDRIDDTADRVRSNVRVKTSAVVGFLRGLRVALEYMRRSQHQAHEHVSEHEQVRHHEHVDEGETTWQTDTIVPATTKAAAAVS